MVSDQRIAELLVEWNVDNNLKSWRDEVSNNVPIADVLSEVLREDKGNAEDNI